MLITPDLEEKLFCEIGVSLGVLSQAQVNKALEQQKVDRAIGEGKPIGAYFLSENVLTKEQIGNILAEQDRRKKHSEDKIKSLVQGRVSGGGVLQSGSGEVSIAAGEGVEKGYCPRCSGDVLVKVTKRQLDFYGCGLGCIGQILNFSLCILTMGLWFLFVHLPFVISMKLFWPVPNDLVECTRCGAILKK